MPLAHCELICFRFGLCHNVWAGCPGIHGYHPTNHRAIVRPNQSGYQCWVRFRCGIICVRIQTHPTHRILLLFNGPGNLMGGPIGGALYDASGRTSFKYMIITGGCLQIAGGLIICWGEY